MIETHVRRGNGVRMKKLLMTVAFCAVAGSPLASGILIMVK